MNPEDRALVAACLAGEAAGLEALVVRHHAAVRQCIELAALRWGGAVLPADVEDAVQQAFFAILSHDLVVLRHWRGQARLKTYLSRVSARVAARHFQRTALQRNRFRLVFSAVTDADGETTLDPALVLEQIAAEAQADPGALLEPALEERLVQRETRERLRAAILERLSEKGRDFYRHLFVDELDIGEICRREDTNANNVYQWKNRILKEAAAAAIELGLTSV